MRPTLPPCVKCGASTLATRTPERCSPRPRRIPPDAPGESVARPRLNPSQHLMPKDNKSSTRKELSSKQREELFTTLKARFEKNMNRHQGLEWAKVRARLEANGDKLWSLNEMERTGGEPDVVGHDRKTGEYIFYDCSAESPKGRRNVCYDGEALES